MDTGFGGLRSVLAGKHVKLGGFLLSSDFRDAHLRESRMRFDDLDAL